MALNEEVVEEKIEDPGGSRHDQYHPKADIYIFAWTDSICTRRIFILHTRIEKNKLVFVRSITKFCTSFWVFFRRLGLWNGDQIFNFIFVENLIVICKG